MRAHRSLAGEFKRYFGVTPGEDAARMRTMQGAMGHPATGQLSVTAILPPIMWIRQALQQPL